MEEEKQKVVKNSQAVPRRNRGFYVRMKFLHSNNNKRSIHHQWNSNSSNHNNSIFLFLCNYKYFLVWIFLSLYFLFTFSFFLPSSYNNNNNNGNDDINRNSNGNSELLPKTSATTFSHLVSRALSESSAKSSSAVSSLATSYRHLHLPSESARNQDSLNDLKIYVYDLPSKYNSDWLINERCSKHLFASEVAIHKSLLNSEKFRTFDPYEADFFFVPVYVSCNFSKVNGFPAIGHARSLISSAIDYISTNFPFWNRSHGGSDHVFVASHDFGSCFHTMEDVAIADGVPEMLKKSIILQTFGVKYKHPCQEVEHVVIPPYIPPESVRSTLQKFPLAFDSNVDDDGRRGMKRRRGNGHRDIFAFFRGKMEIHPKNVSGRFYSKAVRTKIWNKFNTDSRFYLKRHRFTGYQTEIARSKFCLCPLGWAPWSPRLVESVALGCVPVIIADGIDLPFSNSIPWKDISLTVAEQDVEKKLGKILEHVANTNLSAIQRNIWDQPNIRRALLFHDHIIQGDATWQVLLELSYKIGDRSHRSSRGLKPMME